MNEGNHTPAVPQMIKFINEKTDYTAKVDNNSWNHNGRTHSSGVRYTSGHKVYSWKITVMDENNNVVYDETPYKTSDFTVWIFNNIMKRKHWRYDQSTIRRGENYTFDEFEQIKIENERNDPTRD